MSRTGFHSQTDPPAGTRPPEPASGGQTGPTLSIVVAAYNEEDVLDLFFARLEEVLGGIGESYEIVCVNDGSRDRTAEILASASQRDARIKVINLARNFGKELALTAGLDHTSGRAVVPLDADLQDPPELISEFVRLWREGYDVVYAVRNARDTDSWLKRNTAAAFYAMLNRVSNVDIPKNAGDFRLMDRRVVEALKGLRERNRFMKGLFSWVGFRQRASNTIVPDGRRARPSSTTGNYGISRWTGSPAIRPRRCVPRHISGSPSRYWPCSTASFFSCGH